jgi:hypothetical protein
MIVRLPRQALLPFIAVASGLIAPLFVIPALSVLSVVGGGVLRSFTSVLAWSLRTERSATTMGVIALILLVIGFLLDLLAS